MKRILLIAALLFNLASLSAASTAAESDVVVQTRFNKGWSHIFLSHVRAVLMQNGLPDPYRSTIEKPLIFDLGPRLTDFTKEGRDWYRLLLEFLKIDMIKSDFRLVIEKFNYGLDNLDATIVPASRSGHMLWNMKHNVQGLELGAQKIALEVSLHSTTGRPIIFAIELLGAELEIDGETLPVEALWKTVLGDETINLKLERVDLREALKKLHSNPDSVKLNFRDLIVPEVEIRVGNRSVKIDPVKFKNWILREKESMKKFILDIIVLRNIEVFEDPAGEDDLEFNFPKSYFEETEMLAGAMSVDGLIATQNHARARLKGVLCLPGEATDVKSCLETAPVNPRADRSNRDYSSSMTNIFRILEDNQANIVVSIGEPFINQALTAAVKAGLLAQAFSDGEISLAEGGVLMTIDKEGDVFHGYIHLTNKITGVRRTMTGRSSITFPVHLGLRLKLEQKNDIPHLAIEVVEASAPTALLLKGAPEVGMASNIATVPRFRSKVIQEVQESVKKFTGTTLIELPMPFLKSTFFEKTKFKSDGLGRANALFKVEEKRALKYNSQHEN